MVASAIRNHAVTSSIAAQAIASEPTGRLSIRRSARIRASTGNAVIDIATPMNRANATNFLLRPHQLVQRQRHRDAEQHRHRDARVGDRCRLRGPALELIAVDLETHQEHVEDQPEVGGNAQRGQDVGREDRGLEVGRDRAEHRRAEHEPRDHLAHHSRLTDLHREDPERAGDDQHDRDGEEERGHQLVEVGALLGGGDLLARRATGPTASSAPAWRRPTVDGTGVGDIERDQLHVLELQVVGGRRQPDVTAAGAAQRHR